MNRLITTLFVVFALLYASTANSYEKARVIVMSDIGGSEPDDQQSFVRFLLYANEIDIVGLIGANSQFGPTRGDVTVFKNIIDVYGTVIKNLNIHSEGYPSAEYLKSVVHSGQRTNVGMAGVGSGHSTSGSNLIVTELKKKSDRPLWFLAWGGLNTLSQALWEIKFGPNKLTDDEIKQITSNIRIYDIAGQDDSGAWIAHNFPGIYYLRSGNQFLAFTYRSGAQGHPSQDGNLSVANSSWFSTNIQSHSPLGSKYPKAVYMYEGDSPSFMFLVRNGLHDPEYPHYGSWGGRFERNSETPPERYSGSENSSYMPAYVHNNAIDSYTYNGKAYKTIYTPLWRWREEYQNDFAARMDWTVTSDYLQANHAPQVIVNGDNTKDVMYIKTGAGNTISLDASKTSDPDGNDVTYNWWNYLEPGTYKTTVTVEKPTQSITNFTVPQDATEGDSIHIVLSVTDNGKPELTSYRRIVVIVGQSKPINIASIGGSLTQGESGYNSYRRSLWNLLKTEYNIDFVGSQNTVYSNESHPNDDFDTDHEGHWGASAEYLLEKMPQWLQTYTPDIALLLIGQDDLAAGKTPDQIVSDIESIIEELRNANSKMAILLGSLIPSDDVELSDKINQTNTLLLGLSDKISTDESIVLYINHYATITSDMIYKDFYPNEKGESVIAQNWLYAINAYFKGTIHSNQSAPTGFSAPTVTKSEIVLKWNDNATNEVAYSIERKNKEGIFEEIATLPFDSENFTDESTGINAVYEYRIGVENLFGKKLYSEILSISTFAPTQSEIITIELLRDVSVQFSWKTENNTEYTVERSTDNFNTVQNIEMVSNGLVKDEGLTPLETYTYKITASNIFGTYSKTFEVQTLETPPVTEYTIKLNFGSQLEQEGWNALGTKYTKGIVKENVRDSDGNITDVGVELLDDLQGISAEGKQTGDDSGIFPDNVIKESYYVEESGMHTIRIFGLDTDMVYTLTMTSTRRYIEDDRYTVFTINGVSKRLNAKQNISDAVVFENITSSDGIIDIAFAKEDGSSFGYINGMTIEGAFLYSRVKPCFNFTQNNTEFSFTTDCSENIDNATFSWDFGDGTTSDQANPVHNYSKQGEFPVNLTIIDGTGKKYLTTKTIIISHFGYSDSSNCTVNHTIYTDKSDFKGSGYLQVELSDGLNIPFEAIDEKDVEIKIRYWAQSNAKMAQLLVNDTYIKTIEFQESNIESWQVTSVTLSASKGLNRVKIYSEENSNLLVDEIYSFDESISFINCTNNIENIKINQGWNLISISTLPFSSHPSNIVSGNKYSRVKNYDAFYIADFKKHFNKLDNVKIGEGYMFYFDNETSVSMIGLEYDEFNNQLVFEKGWNLIGLNIAEHTNISALFESYADLKIIKDAENFIQRDGTGQLKELKIGRAYHMYFE